MAMSRRELLCRAAQAADEAAADARREALAAAAEVRAAAAARAAAMAAAEAWAEAAAAAVDEPAQGATPPTAPPTAPAAPTARARSSAPKSKRKAAKTEARAPTPEPAAELGDDAPGAEDAHGAEEEPPAKRQRGCRGGRRHSKEKARYNAHLAAEREAGRLPPAPQRAPAPPADRDTGDIAGAGAAKGEPMHVVDLEPSEPPSPVDEPGASSAGGSARGAARRAHAPPPRKARADGPIGYPIGGARRGWIWSPSRSPLARGRGHVRTRRAERGALSRSPEEAITRRVNQALRHAQGALARLVRGGALPLQRVALEENVDAQLLEQLLRDSASSSGQRFALDWHEPSQDYLVRARYGETSAEERAARGGRRRR